MDDKELPSWVTEPLRDKSLSGEDKANRWFVLLLLECNGLTADDLSSLLRADEPDASTVSLALEYFAAFGTESPAIVVATVSGYIDELLKQKDPRTWVRHFRFNRKKKRDMFVRYPNKRGYSRKDIVDTTDNLFSREGRFTHGRANLISKIINKK